MHWLWNFFLEKRQFSTLLILALIGIGTYSLFVIPKESAPEVVVPIGIVSTAYPGAPAADIEELITNKLEDNIGNIANIDTLTSISRDSFSSVTVQFDAKANIDKSIEDLKDAVDTAKSELPRDASDPIVTKVSFANDPILVISISADLPPTEFTHLGEQLVDAFSNVTGVSEVSVSGTRAREIQVTVREEALAAYHLSTTDVSAALATANLVMPVGTVETNSIEYAIRFEGDIETKTEIENTPVSVANGQPIYIRDIATVTDGVERQSSISRVSVDGSPAENAMTLSLFKRAGGDVTEMSNAAHARLKELQAEGGLLADSQVLVVFDQGEQVKKDLTDLVETGFETIILVVICLLLTIGWRESLVAALSIPLSFVIAFIGLYASGNTINFVSLFALILAVGILVDSGIVVTEAIHTRMRTLKDPDAAARAAIHEYAWPLIAGTMTTIAVFVPLFFLSGIVGEFIASIPYTIIFVLAASIFVALGMVPLIAIYLTKHSSSNKFEEIQEEYTHKAQVWYREKLVTFLKNARAQRIFLWSLTIALLLSLTLPFTGLLKVIFFPPEDVDYVFVEIETPQGTPLTTTDLAIRTAEEMLYDKPYVESFTSTAGSGSSFTGSTNSGGKFGNITVTLKENRKEGSAEISDDLRKDFAQIKNAKVTVQELVNGPPTGAPVFIKFIGDDLEALAALADRAERLLKTIEGVRDINTSTVSNATEVVLTVDRSKASAAGVSPMAVGEILRSAVFGTTATTITRSGEDIDIIVKLNVDPAAQDPSATPDITLDALRNLSIRTQNSSILLGSILREELGAAHASITHEDEERVESVSAYTDGSVTAGEVVAAFKSRESELEVPEGIRISYGGETEDVNQSFTEMFLALIAGLVLMLAILVLSFNSVRYALYLLLAVPLSLIGVFGGLTLTGQALSFTSLLGVIALAGVIINHAIILMDSLLNFHEARPKDNLVDVVADASVSRLRPIFLTTITTVVGMIPLSTISDFWSPLAFAIMFGLAFAMILTLVLVPTLFYRREKRVLERMKA